MLQNKKLADKKTSIWKSFTIIDFLVLLFLIFMSLTLAIPTNNFDWKFKLGLFLIILGSTFWILLFSKKHNCRFYVLAFRAFKFFVGVRKYSKKNKNDTHFLIPYQELIENDIVANRKNNFGIFNHFSIIQIKGFNVFINSETDIELEINKFIEILNSIEDKITIIKSSSPINLSSNLNKIDTNANKDLLKTNVNAKKYCEANSFDLEALNLTNKISNYYFVIYGNSVEDLKEKRNKIFYRLSQTKFNPTILKDKEIIKVLNLIFDISLENKDFSNFDFKELAPKNVEFCKKYLIADNKYISFQSINDFSSFEIQTNWVNKLFSSESTVIWNLSAYDSTLKDQLLDKADSLVKINNNSKSKVKTSKSAIEIAAIENLIYLANVKNSNIFNSNFIFINRGNDLKELLALELENQLNASEVNANLNPLLFLQKQSYVNSCLINSDNLHNDIEMVSDNVAWGWGFINSDLNDNNSLLFGFDKTTNSPLLFDIKTKNSKRSYSNLLITGIPGSGKSTIIKKLLMHYLVFNTEIIVIDPQREYSKLANIFGGNIFEMGTGINTLINPLQLDLQLNEDINNVKLNKIILANNIRKVQKFLKLMCNFNDLETRFISKSLSELYNKWKFYDPKINFFDLKNEDYPTMSDYINFLEKYNFSNQNDEDVYLNSKKLILATLKSEFENNSPNKDLYNGYTNINLTSKFSVFDTYNLSTKDDSPSSKAGLFLILSFIQNKIASNYFADKSGNNWIMLVIDEAHKFIDPVNPIALDFVWDTAKTIRKYRGMLILGTQNFMDFNQNINISSKSAGIMENMQYTITLKSNSKDLETYKSLFIDRIPLTEQEAKFIATAPVGEGILSLDNTTRFQFDAYFNEFEQKIIFKDGDLKNKE
ncbi:hypothetical protein DMC14_002580 [Metamycoplasma phocicerebrale]|uniref:AAA+ ATPase domain-containing protein n=1 Tax=Metamycoplasma phocicerebrale TaxID=142649 RepID=A0A3T0TUM2_9BACT|nr:ATP-binding protein [Metamycoplasma phocicerebrale]AZZ65656.1 hypothetical protein DMC14_002580 [Metamycoplasma phocicerebrale]